VKICKRYTAETGNESTQSYYGYGYLVVSIRHDSTEIWGFRYGLRLGIGVLKIMAYWRVICSLKFRIGCDSQSPSTILTNVKKHRKGHSHQKMGPERDFYEEGNAQRKQTAIREYW